MRRMMKMKMMMTRFYGAHHTLVMLCFFFVFFFFFLQSPVTGEEHMMDAGDLSELLSREEMVQMAGYGEEKLSTVLVTGSVLCETHGKDDDDQIHAWPIPGALVAVNCHGGGGEGRWEKLTVAGGVTDEYGDFIIDLPSYLHAIPNLEKICRVKVNKIPKNSKCQKPSYVKRQKKLILSTFGNGIRTYSAGNFRLNQIDHN